jgi:hypothetical protein
MRALVLGVRGGEDGDDVLELADERLDLGLRELAGGRLAAELTLEPLALPVGRSTRSRRKRQFGVTRKTIGAIVHRSVH